MQEVKVEETSILTDELFVAFVKAASQAPSSDNMQPWEFKKGDARSSERSGARRDARSGTPSGAHGDACRDTRCGARTNEAIEVFCVKERLLSIDVNNMFTWISIGAAIQNLATAASAYGLGSDVEYSDSGRMDTPVAIVRLSRPGNGTHLADWIGSRRTNRRPFHPQPLDPQIISRLMESAKGFDSGIYCVNSASSLQQMAAIDIDFSSIFLEHKPFFDGLFDTIRFTRREIETVRLGMDLKSLEIPFVGFAIARLLKDLKISRIIGRVGIGRIVARILSSRLTNAGALFLITVRRRNRAGYMQAGRTMQQLWLAATAEGLSVHPYGVIPQYFTMAELEPEKFLSKHLGIINGHRDQFHSIFLGSDKEHPAIMLRIGRAEKTTPRNEVRLKPYQLIRIARAEPRAKHGRSLE